MINNIIRRSKYEPIYEALSVLPLYGVHLVPFDAIPCKPRSYKGILSTFHKYFPVTICSHIVEHGLLFVRVE